MENRESFLKGIYVTRFLNKRKQKGKCSLGKGNYFNCIGISKNIVVEKYKKHRGEDEENSDFRIYPDYHKIYRGQTEIVLTKAEYELFMLLSGRPGVIFYQRKNF